MPDLIQFMEQLSHVKTFEGECEGDSKHCLVVEEGEYVLVYSPSYRMIIDMHYDNIPVVFRFLTPDGKSICDYCGRFQDELGLYGQVMRDLFTMGVVRKRKIATRD